MVAKASAQSTRDWPWEASAIPSATNAERFRHAARWFGFTNGKRGFTSAPAPASARPSTTPATRSARAREPLEHPPPPPPRVGERVGRRERGEARERLQELPRRLAGVERERARRGVEPERPERRLEDADRAGGEPLQRDGKGDELEERDRDDAEEGERRPGDGAFPRRREGERRERERGGRELDGQVHRAAREREQGGGEREDERRRDGGGGATRLHRTAHIVADFARARAGGCLDLPQDIFYSHACLRVPVDAGSQPRSRMSADNTTNEALASAQDASDAIDIHAYWRTIVRRRWLVIPFFVAAVLVTAIVTLRQTKIYDATCTIIIDLAAPRVLEKEQVQEVVDSGAGAAWYSREYYETQYRVITSRAVAQRVSDKLQLGANDKFLGVAGDDAAKKRPQIRSRSSRRTSRSSR